MTILPDILAPNLDIIFCGTAIGNVLAQRWAYYAGPGDKFWATLFEVGLTPRLLQPEEYRKLLPWPGYGYRRRLNEPDGRPVRPHGRMAAPAELPA